MSEQARKLREEALALIAKAKEVCDHSNHRHNYDSDGPGYTCNDCGEYGYGPCPESWTHKPLASSAA